MSYVVIGVREDGTRRMLVDGLTWNHAEKAADLIVETRVYREVLVQPELFAERRRGSVNDESVDGQVGRAGLLH